VKSPDVPLDAVCVRVADMPKRQNASHVSPRQPA